MAEDPLATIEPRDVALAAIAANRILIDLMVENELVNRGRMTYMFSAKAKEMADKQKERNASDLLRMMGAAV